MDKLMIRPGDLYEIDGRLYRLFYADPDIIGAIDMDVVSFITIATPLFTEEAKAGRYVRITEEASPISVPIAEKDRPVIAARRSAVISVLNEEKFAWDRSRCGRGDVFRASWMPLSP